MSHDVIEHRGIDSKRDKSWLCQRRFHGISSSEAHPVKTKRKPADTIKNRTAATDTPGKQHNDWS